MAEITTFDNAYQRMFGTKIDLLQQQMDARLRGRTSEESITGAEAFEFDQIAATNLIERTTRKTDTPIIDIPHRRRVLQGRMFEGAEIIDKIDQNRFKLRFEQSFVDTWAAAAVRQHDKNIIDAFDATALVGKGGTETAAFDTNYSIAAGAVGLNVDKLRQASRILKAAENMKDNDRFRWYFVVSSAEEEDLLQQTEVTSADFNTVRALVDGSVNSFLGFEFTRSEQLNLSGSERKCFGWVKNSMKLGVAESGSARIGERADKSYGIQVYYSIDSGATRCDEKGVVRVLCA